MQINYDYLIKQLEQILSYKRFSQMSKSKDYKMLEEQQEQERQKKVKRQERFKQIQSWLGLDKIKKRNKQGSPNKNKLETVDFKQLASQLEMYRLASKEKKQQKRSQDYINAFDIEENEFHEREREIQLFKLPKQTEEEEFRQIEYFQTMSMHQLTVNKAKEALNKCHHLSSYQSQCKYQNKIFRNLKKISQSEQLIEENEDGNQMQFYEEEQKKLENENIMVEWEKQQKREEHQTLIKQDKLNNLLKQLHISMYYEINENCLKDIILDNTSPRERKIFIPTEEPIKRTKRMSLQIEARLSKFYPERFSQPKNSYYSQYTVQQAESPKKRQSLPKILPLPQKEVRQSIMPKADKIENKFFKGRFKQLISSMNITNMNIKQQQIEAKSIMENMMNKVREASNRHSGKLQLEYLKENQ